MIAFISLIINKLFILIIKLDKCLKKYDDCFHNTGKFIGRLVKTKKPGRFII